MAKARAKRKPKEPDDETHPRTLGHYETVEQIGQGGMAVVYKGVQPSLNREVAIKVLPKRFARTPELIERFDREANIAAQLKHPNIVQVIDRGKEGNTLFIVMEYVEGKGLDQLIKERKLGVPEVIHYAVQICNALEYAHGQGVIHRDLKPSNVLVYAEGDRAMITDFGIAQFDTSGTGLSTLTTQGAALGTMNYMSPEQRLDSHTVTHLTDIFAFGIVIYEMLTGKLPIGHFKLPSFVNANIPIGFDGIVKKCLAEAPEERYQSAGEVREALGHITARHGTFEKAAALTRWIPKGGKRMTVGLAAGAAVVVVVAAVLVFLALRRPPPSNGGPTPPRVRNTTPHVTPPGGSATESTGPVETTTSDPPPVIPATGSPTTRGTETTTPRPPIGPRATPKEEARLQKDFARATALLDGGDREQAFTLLGLIAERHPKHRLAFRARFSMARAYEDMARYSEAKVEYANLVKLFPNSPRVGEARLGKCRMDWKTTPAKGTFKKWYTPNVQEMAVKELQEIVAAYPNSGLKAGALALIAEISQKPKLNDWQTAAEALAALYKMDPKTGPDSIYRAAQIYDERLKQKKPAIANYQRFVKDFRDDKRYGHALERIAILKIE